jgi:hypothetical protein
MSRWPNGLPLVEGAGGRLVTCLKVTDAEGGDPAYGMVLVMNAESKDAGRASAPVEVRARSR